MHWTPISTSTLVIQHFALCIVSKSTKSKWDKIFRKSALNCIRDEQYAILSFPFNPIQPPITNYYYKEIEWEYSVSMWLSAINQFSVYHMTVTNGSFTEHNNGMARLASIHSAPRDAFVK